MSDPVTLILLALLAPVVSFLLIAAVPPLRRAGRPAAFVSIAAVLTSLASAIRTGSSRVKAPSRSARCGTGCPRRRARSPPWASSSTPSRR